MPAKKRIFRIRNKLEVDKILHTGEGNKQTSVLCHLINPFLNMTVHLLESNYTLYCYKKLSVKVYKMRLQNLEHLSVRHGASTE